MFTVAITGKSGSGKSLLAKHLETKLANCKVIHADKSKLPIVYRVLKDRPLLKYQWNDPKALDDTLVLLSDKHAYEVVMQYADPIVGQEIQQQVDEARAEGKDYAIVDYCEFHRMAKFFEQADRRICVAPLTDNPAAFWQWEEGLYSNKVRHKLLKSRHSEQGRIVASDELYEVRDNALEFRYDFVEQFPHINVVNVHSEPDKMERYAQCIANYYNDGDWNHVSEECLRSWRHLFDEKSLPIGGIKPEPL